MATTLTMTSRAVKMVVMHEANLTKSHQTMSKSQDKVAALIKTLEAAKTTIVTETEIGEVTTTKTEAVIEVIMIEVMIAVMVVKTVTRGESLIVALV